MFGADIQSATRLQLTILSFLLTGACSFFLNCQKKLFLNKQIDTEEQKIHIKKYILIILISKVLNNFFDYSQVKISYRRFNEIYFTDLLYTKLISVTVCI